MIAIADAHAPRSVRGVRMTTQGIPAAVADARPRGESSTAIVCPGSRPNRDSAVR